jgi:hypothetical protein
MPLTYPDVVMGELTERQARARKVQPQYGEGELVKVGWARNEAEADLIAGMLLEEGVPSIVRRARGFDVPDYLAGGPRDILVAASGVDVARDILRTAEQPPPTLRAREPIPSWIRAMALVLVVVTLAGSVAAALAGFL